MNPYNRSRLLYETQFENAAMNIPRKASELGSLAAMEQAGEVLDKAKIKITDPVDEIKENSGLFANCLSGEMFELTEQERLMVVRHIVNVTGGAVCVVASGTFGGDIQSQADFVKKLYETGVNAVIVLTNMLAGQQQAHEIFNENMFKLLDLTDRIPMGFYECPDPYKRLISPEQVKLFTGTKRIIYLKDTCSDLEQVKQKIKAGKGQNFGLYDAYMGHAVASLKAGASGLSCIQGNYWPEFIVWLCENYDNASLKAEVDKVQQFFTDNMEFMHHVYPVTAKYYLQQRGLSITTFTRQQTGEFTEEIKYRIRKLYTDYWALVNYLGLNLKF